MNIKKTFGILFKTIIVIMGIMVVAGLIQVYRLGGIPPYVQTKNIMGNLEHDIVIHWHNSGTYVSSLTEFENIKKEEWDDSFLKGIDDGWDNPLLLEYSNNIPVRIVSLGEDGRPMGVDQNADLVLDIKYGDQPEEYSRGFQRIYERN